MNRKLLIILISIIIILGLFTTIAYARSSQVQIIVQYVLGVAVDQLRIGNGYPLGGVTIDGGSIRANTSITIGGLTSCDSINTTANGTFICGIDAGGTDASTLGGFSSAFYNPLNKTFYGMSINLTDNITASIVRIVNLTSCDTIDTTLNGTLICGSDSSGASSSVGWSSTSLVVYNNTSGISIAIGTDSGGGYNLTVIGHINASQINGTRFNTTGTVQGDVGVFRTLDLVWANLTGYPSACTSSQTITTIGDTITCSAISITESQISNLQSYLLNNTDINATRLNVTGDINSTRVFTKQLTVIDIVSCTEALETTANGTIYCGSDATGAGGSALGWATPSSHVVANNTAGVAVGIGTNTPSPYNLSVIGHINASQGNYTRLNATGTIQGDIGIFRTLNLVWANLTGYPSACTNQFITTLDDTPTCTSINDGFLTAGFFSSIFGIGVQNRDLDMGGNGLNDVLFIDSESTFKVDTGGNVNGSFFNATTYNGTFSNTTNLNVTGSVNFRPNVTIANTTANNGHLVISQGQRTCYNGEACTKYMFYNGTHVVIQG